MKMTKSILTMAAAMAATVGYAGDSAPFRLDTSTSPVGDSLSISWDASWIGGNANATVVIKDNGTEVKRTTGSGQFTYSLSSAARHELTYMTYIGGVAQSEVYATTAYSKYEVTFDANGGSVGEAMRYVTPGSEVGTLPEPTRTGYTFNGWWTSASGGTQVSTSTKATGHVAYYAHWTVNQYTVTYKPGASGSGSQQTATKTHGVAMALKGAVFTRDGYTQTGWATSDGGAKAYDLGASYTANVSVTFYPFWTKNASPEPPEPAPPVPDTYVVTYRPGTYGTGALQAAMKTEGVVLMLAGAVFTRDGYVQTGWATSDGGAKAYDLGASYAVNAAITLYPFWSANTYKLALKPNSTTRGSVSGGGTYKIGATATLKAKAKSGYVFAGWFKDKSCKKALNPEGYDNRSPTVKYTMPAKNTTIYAKFVTKAAAKKSLKFSSATKKLAKTAKKATAGKAFSLALGMSSASLPTVTAKSLPKGLKIDKATGKITGNATVPGSFTATVTVKDAAGNTITQKVKFTVSVPSWAKGTFYGTAKPDGKTLSYLKFTVGSTGKVSGKVTYSGKAYSFTAKYKSCTASKATFVPTVKVGSKTFKPGTVTVKTRKAEGLSLVEAANSKATFAAQKKANLVKKGKTLAALVGKTFTFTKVDAGSGLTKDKDNLTVKLASGDAVTVSGTVGGKKLTAISWVTLVSDVTAASGAKVYTLYVDIIDAKLKYEKTLVITATVGSGDIEATAAFAK